MSPSQRKARPEPVPAVEPSLRVDGIVRRYGHLRALDGVSFTAPAGAATVVLGPNGAGKTTLLEVLAGLERADRGRAWHAGTELTSRNHAMRARIGLVAHQPLVYPSLTAEENLRFSARLRGGPSNSVDEALRAVDLSRHRHRRAATFSRGMLQRLTIARAILHDPELLLMDEPFTGLDPEAADRLAALLRGLTARGRTLLVSTHDLERAEALSDRVVILDRGRVVWQGAPDGRDGDRGAGDGDAGDGGGEAPALGASTHEPADASPSDLRARYRAAIRGDHASPARRHAAAGRAGATTATGLERPEPPLAASMASTAASLPAAAAEPGTSAALETRATRPAFFSAISALVWKDLVVELRAREIVIPVLVFGLVSTVVFQFALPRPTPRGMVVGAGGALWVALLFGSTLGLSRAMSAETEGGGMLGLLMAPVDRGAIFLGKWASSYLLSLLIALGLLPASSLWLGVPAERLPAAAGVVALGLIGWIASGTLLAAMTAGTRAREVLLPLLSFPVVLPLVIPVVELLNQVVAGGAGPESVPLLTLILAFDVIFLVLGFLLFPFVAEA